MFEDVTHTRSRWRTFWPDVSDLEGAREAITLGYGACFVLAGLNAVVAVFGRPAALLDGIVFAILGLLLRRKSRAAAVIAATLMSANIVISMTQVPFVGVLTIILLVCLLAAVRGTFAYRKLARAETAITGDRALS